MESLGNTGKSINSDGSPDLGGNDDCARSAPLNLQNDDYRGGDAKQTGCDEASKEETKSEASHLISVLGSNGRSRVNSSNMSGHIPGNHEAASDISHGIASFTYTDGGDASTISELTMYGYNSNDGDGSPALAMTHTHHDLGSGSRRNDGRYGNAELERLANDYPYFGVELERLVDEANSINAEDRQDFTWELKRLANGYQDLGTALERMADEDNYPPLGGYNYGWNDATDLEHLVNAENAINANDYSYLGGEDSGSGSPSFSLNLQNSNRKGEEVQERDGSSERKQEMAYEDSNQAVDLDVEDYSGITSSDRHVGNNQGAVSDISGSNASFTYIISQTASTISELTTWDCSVNDNDGLLAPDMAGAYRDPGLGYNDESCDTVEVEHFANNEENQVFEGLHPEPPVALEDVLQHGSQEMLRLAVALNELMARVGGDSPDSTACETDGGES